MSGFRFQTPLKSPALKITRYLRSACKSRLLAGYAQIETQPQWCSLEPSHSKLQVFFRWLL